MHVHLMHQKATPNNEANSLVCIYVCVGTLAHVCIHRCMYMWRPEVNFRDCSSGAVFWKKKKIKSVCVHPTVCMDQRTIYGGCFSPPTTSWGLNSGHLTWQQAPLTNEPSHQPWPCDLKHGISLGSRIHQLGKTGWPESPKDLPVSGFLVVGLQAHATYHVCLFTWVQGIQLRSPCLNSKNLINWTVSAVPFIVLNTEINLNT